MKNNVKSHTRIKKSGQTIKIKKIPVTRLTKKDLEIEEKIRFLREQGSRLQSDIDLKNASIGSDLFKEANALEKKYYDQLKKRKKEYI